MSNEIGVSLVFFREHPDGFEPDVHLPLLAANGIRAAELGPAQAPLMADEADTRRLRASFERAGVRPHSIHTPFGAGLDLSSLDPAVRGEGLTQARWCLERLRLLGGRCLIVHPSAEPIYDLDRPARMAQCRDSLQQLADEVDPHDGPKIAVEILPRTCLGHDSAELLALLEPFDRRRVGICLDVNHANLREDVVAATRRLGDRIITTHISDNDGDDERHWLPGKGVIPWRDCTHALLATGYGGPFVYEFGCQQVGDPAAPMDHLLAALRRNAEEFLLGAPS